jgi:DnaJ-class molecular chaperone
LVLSPSQWSLIGAAIDREKIRPKNADKKKPCKNCEGKGTLKKGDKIVRCQRCGGTGIKPS